MNAEPLLLYWMPSPNFGDALSPWLVRAISGESPTYVDADVPLRKYLVTGSILNHATETAVVWGAGLANLEHAVHPHAHLYAVRGPLSRMRARACGTPCPDVYGDPALLLPRLLPRAPKPRYDFGVALHFLQRHLVAGHAFPANVLEIDLLAPVEQVVEQLLSCRRIVSSALHPIIVAHAYGIPAAWVELAEPQIGGDGMKFVDHALSVGLSDCAPVRIQAPVRDALARVDLLEQIPFTCPCPEIVAKICDRLIEACPVPRRML